MDSETSTLIGGISKKRRLGSGQNPLVDLELDAKNYEIQKLKELVQTLHEKVSELQEEKWNASNTLDKENANIKQETEGDKKKFEEEMAKMKSLVKDKETEIEKLKAEISSKSENEEKLQTKIVNLEKSLGTFKTQNSKMEKEIKSLKSKTPKSANEPGLQYVTLEEIVINGVRVNTDLLSPEHVLTVAKLEATEDGLWNIFSTETTVEPFKLNFDDIFDKTQFKINLTGSLTCVDEGNTSRINEIIQCLYTCNHENLNLGYQTIDELAFTKLTPVSVKICKLQNICVKKFTGGFLTADEIFEKLPNVEEFEYYCKRYNLESTQNVPTNLSNFPRFENLKKFKFCNVTNKFDLVTFGKFMAKHPDTSFVVQYHPLCESAQFKIQGVTEKLAETCKISVEFAK
uniref:Uncharacterized protein n=1 Tax=Panagrolaimus sp. PS1159 TaxID=55785 RepID=A0AC35G8S9_9BILA